MPNKPRLFLFIIAISVLAGFASPTLAQEAVPGNACAPANGTIYTGGPETAGKAYLMTCQGGVWVRITESDTAGNLGIKRAAPKAPLHVGGEAILGTSTGLGCDADRAGGVRYNATSKCLELCNGTSWSCISVAACGDATPNTFNFTDLVNQATSTPVTSNILQVTGISCVVNVAISGEGSPQFRTCSDSGCSTVLLDWSASGTIDNNQYLQLRLTTSAIGGDTHSAMVSVGTFADVWNATPTGDCTGSPVPGTICADGTVYAGLSPDGNVKMYTTRCDAGQYWDGAACAGVAMLLTWNDGFLNYVNTNARSAGGGAANTAILVATDSNSVAPGIQLHNAAHYCSGGGFTDDAGYTDWYLPANVEVITLYENRVSIGNFTTANYWSSTEESANVAVSRIFSNNSYSGTGKHSAFRVRCVRK